MVTDLQRRAKAALEANEVCGGVRDVVRQRNNSAVNIDPEHHLGWVLVANLADEANLATGHIGPVLTLALLDLQKLVANAQGI